MATNFPTGSDYIDMGTSANLYPANLTISWWFKADGSVALYDGMLGKTNGGSWTSGWGAYFIGVSTMEFFLDNFSSGYVASGVITPTNWNHFVATYDGTTLTLYVNGVSQGTKTITASSGTADTLYLGILGATTYHAVGTLDDVRIYDRAFAQAEIDTLYASQGLAGDVYGLVAQWRMNEKHAGATQSGAGSIKDLTATYNGTPNGSPTYAESVLRERKQVA